MSGKAATIKLSERQLLILQHIERSTTAAARLIQRVRIILLAFGGLLNSGIAAEVGLKKSQVGLWRRRWRESFEALTLIECQESAAELERAMSVVLSDKWVLCAIAIWKLLRCIRSTIRTRYR